MAESWAQRRLFWPAALSPDTRALVFTLMQLGPANWLGFVLQRVDRAAWVRARDAICAELDRRGDLCCLGYSPDARAAIGLPDDPGDWFPDAPPDAEP